MFSFQSAQEHKNRYRFKILSFFSWYPVEVSLRKRRFSEGMLKCDFLCSSSEIYYFPVSLTDFSPLRRSIAYLNASLASRLVGWRETGDRAFENCFHPFQPKHTLTSFPWSSTSIKYPFLCFAVLVCVQARESENKENRERRLWKTFQSHNVQFIQFKSWGGLVDQHRRQKKLHIALLGRKKYLNYNWNIRLSTIRLKFECCPASVVQKSREKTVYGLNPSSEKFTVKISWLFFFLQMDSHKHTEQGPFRGMNQ